ncbi:hypothetical protein ACTFIT_004314 [Dictyostelium discoideum]
MEMEQHYHIKDFITVGHVPFLVMILMENVCEKYLTGSDCKTLTSVTPTFVSGGNVYLIGDFSNVFNLNLTIHLGDQQCRINNINQTVIECVIGPGEGFHNVTISINVILTFKTIDTPFEYKYFTCPLSCSSHGTCNKYYGSCDCNIGTYGNQCQFFECPLNCSNPNGACDSKTGICNCDDKHGGESCNFILCPLHC